MPRKRIQEKQQVQIIVNGQPITVIMHPPTGCKNPGMLTGTACHGPEALASAGLKMPLQSWRTCCGMVVAARYSPMHFSPMKNLSKSSGGISARRKMLPPRLGPQKSLANCLDAIAAFSEIMGMNPISMATPDDCANFQQVALTLPNNWRRRPVEKRKPVQYFSDKSRQRRQRLGEVDPLDDLPHYSPNNVLRWSRSLQAAFERANRNALKRKCVRGVVPVEKLLTANPWSQFTWIEGSNRPIRQFDRMELLSLLEYFESQWGGVPVAVLAAKVFLWSACRKSEVAGLTGIRFGRSATNAILRLLGSGELKDGFAFPKPSAKSFWGFAMEALSSSQPIRINCGFFNLAIKI